MTTYIITNRTVRPGPHGDVIDDSEPTIVEPTFRAGEVDLASGKVELYRDITAGMSAADRNRSGSNHLFANLLRRVPEGRPDILVVIHGFQYRLRDSIEHMQALDRLYVSTAGSTVGDMVYVSWPSDGSLSASAYRSDRRDAKDTGIVLARVLEKAQAYYSSRSVGEACRRRVILMCHSMGNLVLERTVAAVDEDTLDKLFSDAVLLNADVDWSGFEPGRAFDRFTQLASRTHIYINRDDDALAKSHQRFNDEQRLGWRGPRNLLALPPEVFVVDTTTANAFDGDVPVRERLLDHWGYLYRPTVVKDVLAVVRGEDEDDIAGRQASQKYPRYFSI